MENEHKVVPGNLKRFVPQPVLGDRKYTSLAKSIASKFFWAEDKHQQSWDGKKYNENLKMLFWKQLTEEEKATGLPSALATFMNLYPGDVTNIVRNIWMGESCGVDEMVEDSKEVSEDWRDRTYYVPSGVEPQNQLFREEEKED